MTNNPLALAARIAKGLTDIEKVVIRSEEIYEEAALGENKTYFEALALNLHGFYLGVERVFEDIARTFDLNVPTGSDWHRILLQQMSLSLPSIRPPVVQDETYKCLDEYRGFRHVVRHGYTFDLKIKSVKELAQSLRACFTAVQQDLNNFIQFLHQLAND
ncbi:MAG: hypothetical protein H6656_10440 [Ardenticatenaceae bacterium]|nr:hypothetical protein [Anaerolineales bacterium]MCB9007767.1 hypothetical protein [Ardenticatenaceae bacterium]